MTEKRKLHQEIERVLKRVAEGVDEFESLWEKAHVATNSAQKEKFEVSLHGDLKKEIKKLQRLRDQIKTWQTSSDVKDKSELLRNRKLIETQMERFKVLEREAKTKTFSKGGLSMAAKLDPNAKAKLEVQDWINSFTDQLNIQIDQFETELEALQSKKRRSRKDDERTNHLNMSIAKHREHEQKLEMILRMMDNDSLSVAQVEELRDDLDYYLENNQDNEFIENEYIYDDLDVELSVNDLEDGEEDVGESENDIKPDCKEENKKCRGKQEDEPQPKLEMSKKIISGKPAKPVNGTPVKGTSSLPATRTPSVAEVIAGSKQQPAGKNVSAVARSGTGTAPNVSGQQAAQSPSPSPAVPAKAQRSVSALAPSQSAPPTSNISNEPLSASAPAQAAPFPSEAWPAQSASLPSSQPPQPVPAPASPRLIETNQPSSPSHAKPTAAGTGSDNQSPATTTTALQQANETLAPPEGAQIVNETKDAISAPVSNGLNEGGEAWATSTSTGQQTQQRQTFSASQTMQSAQQSLSQPPTPPAIQQSNPANTQPQSAHETAAHERDDAVVQALFNSMVNMPEPSDSVRTQPYAPRNPISTPAQYPTTPLNISDPAVVEKLDVDTLFVMFYHQPGTYQQYLAARELKRQSWRFHKKYLTWFQRLEDPKLIADEYEQGTYVYFDYESGWCRRRKSDFKFEYRFLEDQELL